MVRIGFIIVLGLWSLGGVLSAQVLSRTDKKHEALNRYVDFANESLHVLWEIHSRLEAFNVAANQYIFTQGNSPLEFRISDMVRDFNFFGVLKGVCAKSYGETDPIFNLRVLYQNTSKSNGYIPESRRTRINEHRDALMSKLIRVLSHCDTLSAYTATRQYERDSRLSRLYQHLYQLSDLFSTLLWDHDRMADEIAQAASPAPAALQDLRDIMHHARGIVRAVRLGDTLLVRKHKALLGKAIAQAEAGKLVNQGLMRQLNLYYDRENTGYTHMIQYAQQIQRRAGAYLDNGRVGNAYQLYDRDYYYYNERLLALFNHHKYGITAYYNRFIGFSNKVLVKETEEVPLFAVIPPPEPGAPGMMSGGVGNEAKESQDISSLQGAAANNLVFLLDVSASMNRPEKLSLLKSAMSRLVDLMRPEDQVAIVIYAGDAQVLLSPTSALFKAEIHEAIDKLRTGGSTKAKKGFREAYKLAEKYFIPNGNNRIIFASDGAFNLPGGTARLIERKAKENIQLTVFLFSKYEPAHVASQLTLMAHMGGGNYAHVYPENADQVLLREAKAVQKR